MRLILPLLFFFSLHNLHANAQFFLQGGLGVSNAKTIIHDFNLNEEFTSKSKDTSFKFGIGYEETYRNFLFALSLQFMGKFGKTELQYTGENYILDIKGEDNVILGMLNIGYKLKKLEPYLLFAFTKTSFSPTTSQNNIIIQNNYLISGLAYGLGINFQWKENIKFFGEIFQVNSKKDGSITLQEAKIKHSTVNVGIKYYF
jgi:opacity protein-like surface antigen